MQGSADLEESSGASDAYDAFSRLFQKVADNYSLLWGEPCTGCVPAKVSRRSSSGPAHKLEKLTHWKSLVLEVAPALAELISGRASSPNSKHNDTDDNDNAHVSRGLNQYDSGQDGADHYGSADMYSSGSHYGSYENYYDEADFTDLEARELTDDVTQVAVFKAGYSGDEAEPFIGVYHMRNAGAIVIKLNTFEGEAGAFSSDNGGFLKSLIMTFQEADAYAQENGVEQLILDMSFNGGGDPTAIFVLLRLVQNGWTKIEDLCDVANIKISDLGEFFYEAGDLSALKSLLGDIEDATSSELDEAIESIQSIFDAIKEMIEAVAEELGLAAEGLMPMYGDILSVEVAPQSLTVNKKRALLEQLIENITKFTQAVWPELSGDGKYSIRTGEAFEGTAWFDEGRQATVRGGANVNYTQFFYAFCPEAMEFFASITGNPNTVVHTFKKAVLLTDGTCGSACSTFATRLMLSGSVRSVSYGGYAGDASMDSSAFGGGNVVSWQSHAIGTVTAFFINLLLGHAPRPIYDMDITDVPIPFPSSASARFTVDCSYEPYLGPRSLPREFYVIPADVHVAMWIEDPGTLPYVGTDGQAMHTDILRAWRRAAEEFSRAPLLSDWLKKDWDYASPVDPSPTNTPSLSDPSLNEVGCSSRRANA